MLPSTYPDPDYPGRVLGRTEVERRATYMEILDVKFGRPYPALLEIVSQCLHNTPELRPTSEQLLSRLHTLKMELEELYGGNIWKQLNIANVLNIREMKLKDKRIQQLQVE